MIPFAKYSTSPGVVDPKRVSQYASADASIEHAKAGVKPLRALIVGAGDVGKTLAKSLETDGPYHVVGFVDDMAEAVAPRNEKLLGTRDDIAALVRKHDIDEVFVAYAPTWQQRLAEELAANSPEVRLHAVPSPYESMMRIGRVESRGDIATVRLTAGTGNANEIVKRAFDLTVALLGLFFLAPFMLVIAALIKFISPGPVIHSQERIGRYGRPFMVYKFRTMVHNAESDTGPVLSSGNNDPRLTRIGRLLKLFRIDEVPQLWNVLRGEMSMVGPRPERPYFVKKYERMIPTYSKRHDVRPGITGLAQVEGGYHTDARDKLRFDLIYASHQSIWFDISILLKTILVVFRPKRH